MNNLKLTKTSLAKKLKSEFLINCDTAECFVEDFFKYIINQPAFEIASIGRFEQRQKRSSNLLTIKSKSGLLKTTLAKYKVCFKTFKSLKQQIYTEGGFINTEVMTNSKIKDNLSIGEVAKLLGVEAHTIRFWTKEFEPHIAYTIGKGERKYYSLGSVEVFKKIQDLIHVRGIKIRFIKENNLLFEDRTPQNLVKQNLACDQEVKVNEALNQISKEIERLTAKINS